MKIVPDWIRGGSDRQLAASNYSDREPATDRAARQRRQNHRARVFRDGDAAGTEPSRRRFGRT
ncbi:hypothetical protein ACIQZO_35030 [Streptomyces sp. NPDC097617]|uniref:hypothetical protein n=1 Tax=Streptomyces sp. NPDC097617 TaxID=3366091 RepID=UPI0037FD5480